MGTLASRTAANIHEFLLFFMNEVRTGSPVKKRKRRESLPQEESSDSPSNNDMVNKAVQLKRRVCTKFVLINFSCNVSSVCIHIAMESVVMDTD